MRHLADGTLRRIVDEPLNVFARDRAHLSSCDHCRERFADIKSDARYGADMLARSEPAVDLNASFSRLQSGLAGQHGPSGAGWNRRRALRLDRWGASKPLAVAALAATLVGGLAFTPAGSWAQSLVTIFQPTQVAPVAVSIGDLRSLTSLRALGTLHVPTQLPDKSEPDATAASRDAGMTVLTPGSLASSVTSAPHYDLIPGTTGSFTFSAAKARRVAAAHGRSLPPMPSHLDGATVQVTTGNTVVAMYGSGTNGTIPQLVVGQMRVPTVSSTGVTVREIEDYMLRLPGVSPSLASAIRAIGNPSTTLPLPIPVDKAHAESVTVQGVQGTAVGDATGIGSVVIWEKGGIIYGVGGGMTQDGAIAVANSLR